MWAWAALEADFAAYYHMDLVQAVYRDGMTMRRFSVLMGGLPGESNWQRWLADRTNRSLVDVGLEGRT